MMFVSIQASQITWKVNSSAVFPNILASLYFRNGCPVGSWSEHRIQSAEFVKNHSAKILTRRPNAQSAEFTEAPTVIDGILPLTDYY